MTFAAREDKSGRVIPNPQDFQQGFLDRIRDIDSSDLSDEAKTEAYGLLRQNNAKPELGGIDRLADTFLQLRRDEMDPNLYRERLGIYADFDRQRAKDALVVDQVKNLPGQIFDVMTRPMAMAVAGTSDVVDIMKGTRLPQYSLGSPQMRSPTNYGL